MASTFTATVNLERDGQPLPGFPVVRRLTTDEYETFNYEKADDGEGTTFTTIPVTELATVQVLYLTANTAVTVRLDGQTDAGIVLSPRGVILILDTTIDASTATNVKINNNSGGVAAVTGIAGGT